MRYRLRHDFWAVENVVLLLAVVFGAVWTFQSVKAMSRNWELTERLATERRNLELLRVEVETAELENEYYETVEYQELAARKYLDKKMPGESLVILPKNSEEAKNKHKEVKSGIVEKKYTNFEKWVKFLFP